MPSVAWGRPPALVSRHATATIEVRRDDGLTDMLRRWAVLVDDVEVGQIRRMRTATFTVEAGPAIVQVRNWLYGSPHLVLDLSPEEHAVLVCRPRHGPFRRPQGFNDHIILEQLR